MVIDMSSGASQATRHQFVDKGDDGLYSLVFARCFESGPTGMDSSGISVSFPFFSSAPVTSFRMSSYVSLRIFR